MTYRMPMPAVCDGTTYVEARITEASAEAVAAVNRDMSRGAIYDALLTWCAETVEAFVSEAGEVSDRAGVRRIARALPFKSAYAVAMLGMAETKGDDEVSGRYQCPQCGLQVEGSERISALETDYADNASFEVELESPVELADRKTGELIERVEAVTMRHPTLDDCIRAHKAHPDDEIEMQFQTYVEALEAVNGRPQAAAWKASFGFIAFKKMKLRDARKVGQAAGDYGMRTSLERVCPKCFRRWEAELDLNDFFASGLRVQGAASSPRL